MKSVQLVVTGEMERLALHESLRGWFDRRAPDAFEFLRPIRVDGITSAPLLGALPRGVLTTAEKFARKLFEQLDEADLVIGVDDLELDNSIDRVVVHVREVIEQTLPQISRDAAALRDQLAVRCSFHFLVPMPEAYFFGSASALERAAAIRTSRFDPAVTDVEAFVVRDEAYEATSGAHPRHPKRYLKYLSEECYRESNHGASALRTLDWDEVLARGSSWARSLRALLDDLLLEAGAEPLPGEDYPATQRRTQSGLLLRNI
jgi:hypothetical protein